MSAKRQGRWAFGLTTGGIVYGALLVAAAFLVPAYQGEVIPATPAGETMAVEQTSETLVAANGLSVVAFVAIPMLASLAVFSLLRYTCRTGSTVARICAALCVGLLAVFSLLAILSIGVWQLPVVLALAAAVTLTPCPRRAVALS